MSLNLRGKSLSTVGRLLLCNLVWWLLMLVLHKNCLFGILSLNWILNASRFLEVTEVINIWFYQKTNFQKKLLDSQITLVKQIRAHFNSKEIWFHNTIFWSESSNILRFYTIQRIVPSPKFKPLCLVLFGQGRSTLAVFLSIEK